MSVGPPELEPWITKLVTPTVGDVLRSKRSVLEQLEDGTPREASELEWALVDEARIQRRPSGDDRLDVPIGSNVEASVDATDPLIEGQRFYLATRIALSESESEGIIQAVEDPRNPHLMIPVQYGGQGGRVSIRLGLPMLSAAGYQLARRIRGDVLPLLDIDLFTAELAPLNLDDRGLRCIREALAAHRHGLFLSCISLLGAASESAWWRLAERLKSASPSVADAVEKEASAATLMRVVYEVLSERKGMKSAAAELYAYATYLRELRNYGIHPRRADPEATEENALTEEGCSLLLLQTQRYLERLASL